MSFKNLRYKSILRTSYGKIRLQTLSLLFLSRKSKQNEGTSSSSLGESGRDRWALCGDVVNGISSLLLPLPQKDDRVGHNSKCKWRSENLRFGRVVRRLLLPFPLSIMLLPPWFPFRMSSKEFDKHWGSFRGRVGDRLVCLPSGDKERSKFVLELSVIL